MTDIASDGGDDLKVDDGNCNDKGQVIQMSDVTKLTVNDHAIVVAIEPYESSVQTE